MSVTVPLNRSGRGERPRRAAAYERAVVVVPAHNEVDNLPSCLSAVVTAGVLPGADPDGRRSGRLR